MGHRIFWAMLALGCHSSSSSTLPPEPSGSGGGGAAGSDGGSASTGAACGNARCETGETTSNCAVDCLRGASSCRGPQCYAFAPWATLPEAVPWTDSELLVDELDDNEHKEVLLVRPGSPRQLEAWQLGE